MFTDKQRQIYQSPTGSRFDPLAVERKLRIVSKGGLNSLLDIWEGEDPIESAVAEENLVRVARTAFAYPQLTEPNGVSDADTLDTLIHFLEWLGKVESTAAPLVKSQPCTGCQELI